MYERQYCVKGEKKCAFCINPTTTHQLLTMLIFFVCFLPAIRSIPKGFYSLTESSCAFSTFVCGLVTTGPLIVNATRVWVRVCLLVLVLHLNSSQVSSVDFTGFSPCISCQFFIYSETVAFSEAVVSKNMLLSEAS